MESHATQLDVPMPDKGFAIACSSVGLGHNFRGKSLKTSLIVLSKDQVSISDSESVDLAKFVALFPQTVEC